MLFGFPPGFGVGLTDIPGIRLGLGLFAIGGVGESGIVGMVVGVTDWLGDGLDDGMQFVPVHTNVGVIFEGSGVPLPAASPTT